MCREKLKHILLRISPQNKKPDIPFVRILEKVLIVAIHNDFPQIVTEFADQIVPFLVKHRLWNYLDENIGRFLRDGVSDGNNLWLSLWSEGFLTSRLREASRKGSLNVMALLIDAKANVNDAFKSPLHAAVQSGQTAAVAKLLEAKCDASRNNARAVFCATSWNDVPMLQLLASAKADMTTVRRGLTPLEFALKHNQMNAAEFLQSHTQQQQRFLLPHANK